MFLLSFALSIAIYTIFLNAKLSITISLVLFGIFLVGSGIFCLIKRKKKAKGFRKPFGKCALFILLGNLLALLVVCGNLRRKDTEFLKMFQTTSPGGVVAPIEQRTSPTPPSEGGKWQRFNGFGTITDTQKYHTYLFEDETGKVYRLSSNRTYHIGDQLFLSANLKPLDRSVVFDSAFIPPRKVEFRDYQFNYDKWIFMKGIDGTAYEKTALLIDPSKPGTVNGKLPPEKKLGMIDRVRAGMQGYVEKMFGENQYAGLLLGLLIGDKSLIPSEAYETFTNSGLVHIIAVSGGNIAMVVILLSFLLKWVPLYVRNGLILLMIIFYATICGGDSSVVRAAIMGCLTLIALFRGREVSIWRSMKYAFVGILLFSPFSLVYDVGLLLSFSAIIGIVLFQKITEDYAGGLQKINDTNNASNKKKKKEKGGFFQSKFWKEYLTPTIGASLGTAPILMFFMNGVNLVGILLNVIIVPLIPVVTIYGFACLLLYAIVSWSGWVRVEVLLMKVIYGLSEWGAKYAIFVQAKNLVAKYVLVVLFVGLGIWGYRRVMKKPISPKIPKDTRK